MKCNFLFLYLDPIEKKIPKKSKKGRRLGYWAMLDEREKFRSTLLKAFK